MKTPAKSLFGMTFITDESIPVNEVHFCSSTGEILGKIINLASPPPSTPGKAELIESMRYAFKECGAVGGSIADCIDAVYITIQPYLRD